MHTHAERPAGPDRLRFLGIVSRYTALVSELSLNEVRDV